MNLWIILLYSHFYLFGVGVVLGYLLSVKAILYL